jgi:DNA polymerase III sliding clamp (beta) subunit (PCNA family)
MSQDVEIKATADVFLEALNQALRQTKSTISIDDTNVLLRHYYICGVKGGEGGTLTFLATTESVSSRAKCEAKKMSSDFNIILPGVMLTQLAANIEKGDVTMIIKEGKDKHEVEFTSGQFKCTLIGQPLDDISYFELPETTGLDSIKVPRSDFLDKLKRISFSVSDNAVKTSLYAVRVVDGTMQSSNGRVTALAQCPWPLDLTIPAGAVPELLSTLSAVDNNSAPDVDIFVAANHIIFQMGEAQFICRKSDAKFPPVIKLIDKPTRSATIDLCFDKDRFKRVIRRVAVVANKETMELKLGLKTSGMTVEAGDKTGNEASEVISKSPESDPSYSWNGKDDSSVSFNHEHLFEVIDNMVTKSVKIKFPAQVNLPVRIDEADVSFFLMRLASDLNAGS